MQLPIHVHAGFIAVDHIQSRGFLSDFISSRCRFGGTSVENILQRSRTYGDAEAFEDLMCSVYADVSLREQIDSESPQIWTVLLNRRSLFWECAGNLLSIPHSEMLQGLSDPHPPAA